MTTWSRPFAIPFATAALLLACVPAHAQSTVSISGMVDLGVYRGFNKTSNVGTGYGRLDADGARSKFLDLGADYWLSKGTSIYVSAGRLDPAIGSGSTSFGVGVAHSF